MRFIGSKAALVKKISNFVSEQVKIEGRFGDFFCGTGSVSAHFKHLGCSVTANDNLTFCTILAKAILYNDCEPSFSALIEDGEIRHTKTNTLMNKPYDIVLSYLNQLSPTKGFFYDEYSPGGTEKNVHRRLYFTDENAQKIDAMREKINEWYDKKIVTEAENALLISDLLKATDRVANIAGTYGFFMQKMSDPRVKKQLTLHRSKIITGSKTDHEVYQEDANKLAKKIDCDILYLDPPYTWRHYGAYYHILETIARWDKPKIEGKSGLRPWKDTKSRYCYGNEALSALIELVEVARTNHIFISYSSEGLISHEEMQKNLSSLGKLKIEEFSYQRYKSNNGGDGKTKTIERLYYVKK